MYNAMNVTGPDYLFLSLWGLHTLSVIAFFTGFLFLVVLAIRTFTPAQLKTWALWLLVTGTVVCLFTIAITGRPWVGWGPRTAGMRGMKMENMQRMMEMMEKHDEGVKDDAHEEHGDMLEMMRMMMGR